MKYQIKLTIILIAMFVVTQFIGLYVISHYLPKEVIIDGVVQNVSELPESVQPPEDVSPIQGFGGLIVSFILAILLLLLLSRFGAGFILKAWFFIVVVIALTFSIKSIAFSSMFFKSTVDFLFFGTTQYAWIFSTIIAIPLAFVKIYGRNFFIHNGAELLVYPGIAAILVSYLSQWSASVNLLVIILILVGISLYDMWAVWHSKIMIKMAKYQINELNIFAGFFVPFISKKQKAKIALAKKLPKSKQANQKIRANVAILGGGDVAFPLIAAGVMMATFGILYALFVIVGATFGLGYLLFMSEKKKFYPAMPFITAGVFAGMILSWALL